MTIFKSLSCVPLYTALLMMVFFQPGWNANNIPTGKKSVKETFKEMIETKESKRKGEILKELEKMRPASVEDVEFLSKEMEGGSVTAVIAQELVGKINDAKLAPALIKASEEKSTGLRNLTEKDLHGMGQAERKKEVNRIVNLTVLIETLGNLRNKQAIPILKKFLDYDQVSYPASTALGKIGDEATLNELMQRLDKQKEINVSSFGDKALKKVVKELDDPSISKRKKGNLIRQIKGSRKKEVNVVLKDLALNHKDSDVRAQAGLALVNSIILDPTVGDPDFLMKWASVETKNEDEDMAKYWVIGAIDKVWDDRYVPMLINMLRKSRSFASRSEAARILGKHKAVAAVPYLEETMKSDTDSGVRWEAIGALKKITNKKYSPVHPDDIRTWEEYVKRHPEERNK